MYRDDHNAMALRLDELTRQVVDGDAMRAEIIELRRALSQQPMGSPYVYGQRFGAGERVALSAHTLESFPVWAIGLLHFFTLGLFSLVFFGVQQGRLPRIAHNDPSTGEAIGFQFIPFFNLYWLFFAPMRLCDRVSLQYQLRGEVDASPRGIVLAAAIVTVIPYLGFLSILVLWTIAACLMQHRINRLIELGPPRG